MLNFLKEYSYYIFKMFVNQLGMTMFGLCISMATNNNDKLFLISSIFAVIFYLVLLYTMTWDIGYSEKVRIDGKRMKYNPHKGLYMALVANIPNLILGILITISYYSGSVYLTNEIGAVYPTAPIWVVNLYGTVKPIATLLQAMYSGIINSYFLNSPWIYILISLPAVLVCWIAYIIGVKGKHLTKRFGPQESKE